jgi:hypothetical protein
MYSYPRLVQEYLKGSVEKAGETSPHILIPFPDVLSLMQESPKQPVSARPPQLHELFVFELTARRLELLVRILYWILIGIVLWVYGLIAGICLVIQWFAILILGHRNRDLSDFIRGYLEYSVYVMPYTYVMTDSRPDIMPVKVRIYEEFPAEEKT